MSDKLALSVALIGPVLSIIISALGILLQNKRDRDRDQIEKVTKDADAKKALAEARAVDMKTDMETINFYINLANTLRAEVNNLSELSRKNNNDISILTDKLLKANEENKRLATRNEELDREVQKLRLEVAQLRKERNK